MCYFATVLPRVDGSVYSVLTTDRVLFSEPWLGMACCMVALDFWTVCFEKRSRRTSGDDIYSCIQMD